MLWALQIIFIYLNPCVLWQKCTDSGTAGFQSVRFPRFSHGLSPQPVGNGRHFLGAPKAPGKCLSVAAPLRIEGLRCPVNTLFRPARRVYRAGSRVTPTQTPMHCTFRAAQVCMMVGAGLILCDRPAPTESVYARNAAPADNIFKLVPTARGTCTTYKGDLHRSQGVPAPFVVQTCARQMVFFAVGRLVFGGFGCYTCNTINY